MKRTRSFRAMGCPIAVTGIDIDPRRFELDVAEIVDLAEEWECRFSRFRPESELSWLNARSGLGFVRVSAELYEMVERSVSAAHASGGTFSPLVLSAIENIGYGRDFEAIEEPSFVACPRPVPPIESLVLDRGNPAISLTFGFGVDLGGIAKSAFIDAVVDRYSSEWPGGCVNAGGDLRCWGTPPDGNVWTAGIEYPQRPELDLVQARFTNLGTISAVATSGRNRRKWQTNRGIAHHLIDPETGSWVTGNVETATAFASDTVTADLAAKSLFITVSKNESPRLGGATLGLTIDDRGFGTLWTTNDAHDVEIIPLIAHAVETG